MNAIENVKIRFVTNTTKESKDTLLKRLHRIGFNSINKTDMFTSLSAAVHYVETNHLKPLYLLTDDAKSEFPLIDAVNYDSVVVGLAPDQFNYDKMNEAFRYGFDLIENNLNLTYCSNNFFQDSYER